MYLLTHDNNDPAFNLACEEYFFTKSGIELDMFWRNGPSVIIGRNQNALAEIDSAFTQANGIRVMRRMTGGGAVFHDLGNVNYTHIRNYSGPIDFARFAAPAVSILRSWGLAAELSGRNDILIDGMKVSGTAQTVRGGRVLHHGTLLYSADMAFLSGALRVRPDKYKGRSISSTASRVANISTFMENPPDPSGFMEKLSRDWAEAHPDIIPYTITRDDIDGIETLVREKYGTDDWVYGRPTPYNFHGSVRTAAGGLEAFLQVENGTIVTARLHGDFFSQEDISGLAALLPGLPHRPAELSDALTGERLALHLPGFTREDVLSALL